MELAYGGLILMLGAAWAVPLGILIGMAIGAMPGLNSSGMLAVLLPLLILLPPEVGLIFTISLYAGGEVGNSFPAIILNIPGNASSAVTAAEGSPMMARGEGGRALGLAVMASTLGAFGGGVLILIATPLLSNVALSFSSVEISIVVLFGLTAIAQISSGGLAKGLLAGFLGLLMATVGTDPMWGTFRGTLGSVYLLDGIAIVPALIGLLAFSEVIRMMQGDTSGISLPKAIVFKFKEMVGGFLETLKMPFVVIRSGITGMIVGIIPGAGTSVATFLAYQQAVAAAAPERRGMFGKGSPEGLVSADCANNAAVGGTLVPLLTLGIPGSSASAIMLVIMAYHNLEIGPRLFSVNGDIAYAILWSQLFSGLLIIVMGSALAAYAYKLALIPVRLLIPIIAMFMLIGSFGANGYVFDMWLMLGFGIIGYLMKRYDYPVVALLLGLILGSLFEGHLNRALRMGFGSPELFFTRPLALFLWALLALVVVGPALMRMIRRKDRE